MQPDDDYTTNHDVFPYHTNGVSSSRPTASILSVYRVTISEKDQPLQFQSYFRLCAAIESQDVKHVFPFWLSENEFNLN